MDQLPLPVWKIVPRLFKPPLNATGPATVRKPVLTVPALSASLPPVHWKRFVGKFSVTGAMAIMVPLLNCTCPAPVPPKVPLQFTVCPPVTSSVAPATTLNVPLALTTLFISRSEEHKSELQSL